MIDRALKGQAETWLATWLGASMREFSDCPTPVIPATLGDGDIGLKAVSLGNGSAIVAHEALVGPLREAVSTLPTELLFSTFGAYELSRATLPFGVAVWGPTYHLFGDTHALEDSQLLHDRRIRLLSPSDLENVDYSIFWHCDPDSAAGFGVFEDGDLAALATVRDVGESFMSIGMDVAAAAQRRGLGRAAVGTAAAWILDQGKLVTATVAPFNTPSLRTLRSIGLCYMFTSMVGSIEPMKVFPQQLGAPLPDTEIYNHYPDWAMNSAILPKPD